MDNAERLALLTDLERSFKELRIAKSKRDMAAAALERAEDEVFSARNVNAQAWEALTRSLDLPCEVG